MAFFQIWLGYQGSYWLKVHNRFYKLWQISYTQKEKNNIVTTDEADVKTIYGATNSEKITSKNNKEELKNETEKSSAKNTNYHVEPETKANCLEKCENKNPECFSQDEMSGDECKEVDPEERINLQSSENDEVDKQ